MVAAPELTNSICASVTCPLEPNICAIAYGRSSSATTKVFLSRSSRTAGSPK
jgi:hypothetical protein